MAAGKKMTFLPIVVRELRIRARWKTTYWWRCASALAASAIAAVMLTVAFLLGPAKVGNAMFTTLAWTGWAFCLVEGLRNTTDVLSEEKREGTLGLLFLTDLKGYDVVLGKFVASSLGAFFSFVAALPVLGLSLVHGGVTVGEFWRMAFALMNTLFFSLTASLFVSAVSRRERQAWLGSVLLVGGFTVAVPLAEPFLGWLGSTLGLASPWTLFQTAFESSYLLNPQRFWEAALVVHLLGWLWLLLASVLLPWAWQEKRQSSARAPGAFLRGTAVFGKSEPAVRARLLAVNPVLWLATRDRLHGRLLWAAVGAASAVALGVAATFIDQPSVLLKLWCYGLGLHLLMAIWVAWEACHSFCELRRSGLLELLLASPLRLFQIVQGEELALRRLFLGPLALLAATEVAILAVHGVYLAARGGASDALGTVAIMGALMLLALALWVFDLIAVARVGLWFSLVSRRPAQAWAKTVLWVLLAPTLVSIAPAPLCCGVTTPLLLFAKDLLFINWAKTKLRYDLRAAAARLV
jgi:hypothetical protein